MILQRGILQAKTYLLVFQVDFWETIQMQIQIQLSKSHKLLDAQMLP